MANLSLQIPLKPKNGRVLKVLCICRISGDKQDKLSLEDQEALLKLWVTERYDNSINFLVIAGVGSGEILDRKEAFQIIDEVATGQYDLVIAEDLGRLYRRIEALIFCESCLDEGTRVVAINDHIDTANEEWRMLGFFAVMRHETYNTDTAKRIRRTLRNRFMAGGVNQTFIAGYIKPPGAKNDSEISKDPNYESVYQKWFELLEGGASYDEVADWLNENQIPLGKYARAKRWDGKMVGRITNNTILKGVRQRNKKISDRVHKTGRHRQKNAPADQLLERHCPHLAFIESERYDRIVAHLKQKNRRLGRKLQDGRDPRANVPKKRTRWPGQHIYCGCCGEMFVYGAHGQTEKLMCSGAKGYECWMSVSVDGPKAREKLCAAMLGQLNQIPEFDSLLLAEAQAEALAQAASGQERIKELTSKLQVTDTKLTRLTDAIETHGASSAIMAAIKVLEDERDDLSNERQELQSRPTATIVVPTVSQVRETVEEALSAVLAHDQVAIRLLHQLISKITVFPYRAIDGGHIVLRARLDLNLAAIDPTLAPLTVPGHPWHVGLEIDLFDRPKRRLIVSEVQRLKDAGLNHAQIAQQLKVTLPVIQQAANLSRDMKQRGVHDPYEPLSEPPADYSKLRRHRHKRFRFGNDQADPAA